MCGGCPDITVHEGELYWSCRLEEIKEHGCFVAATPRERPVKPDVKVNAISKKPDQLRAGDSV